MNKPRLVRVVAVIGLLLCSLPAVAWSATATSTEIGGNWDQSSTWQGGIVPTETDDVLLLGTVIANQPIAVKTVTVSPFAQLQLTRDTGRIVADRLINYGRIMASPFTRKITLDIVATFENYGELAPIPSNITMRGDVINQGALHSTLYLAGDEAGEISVIGALPSLYLAQDIEITSDLTVTGIFSPRGYSITGNGHTLTLIPNQAQTWWYGLDAPDLHVIAATGTGQLILNGDVTAASVTLDSPLDLYAPGPDDLVLTIAADRIVNNADIRGNFSFHNVSLYLDGPFNNRGTVGSDIWPLLYAHAVDNDGLAEGEYHVVGWPDDSATGYQYKIAPTLAQLSSATTTYVTTPYSNNLMTLIADQDQPQYWQYRTVRERWLLPDEYGRWSDVQTINVPLDALDSFAPEDFFQFDAIEDVALGERLQLTIYAADPTFSGVVSLRAAQGAVYPRSVTLLDGVWVGDVELFQPMSNQVLYVSGVGDSAGRRGESNPFMVTADVMVPGQITGIVRAADGNVLVDSLVTVTDERSVTQAVATDVTGRYSVTVPPGQYLVSTVQSPVTAVSVNEQQVVLQDLTEQAACVTDRTPVLLLPGIQGSDRVGHRGWFPELYPHIPRWDSGELEVHDPLSVVGFNVLTNKLIAEHEYNLNCDLFTVPYDWSLSIPDIAAQYLAPWIAHAQQVSGQEQVDIVAHSMGGLVARAYIQDPNYATGTVRKLAMVGTPNQGSTQAYFSWEGGDPIRADEFGGTWFQGILTTVAGADQFQTNSLAKNYSIKTGLPSPCVSPAADGTFVSAEGFDVSRYGSCDNYALRSFLRDYAPAVGQLFPTYDFLFGTDGFVREPAYENTFLRALNNQSCRDDTCGHVFNPIDMLSDIDIKLFVGVEKVEFSNSPRASTPSMVTVAPHSNSEPYYTDGVVVSVDQGVGDGTVLQLSSSGVYNNSETEIANDDHGSLMRFFSEEISQYLIN